MTVDSGFSFALSSEDRDRLRWYYEDYLQFPMEPAPAVAADIERRMVAIGKDLFRGTFGTEDGRDLWSRISDDVDQTRVEVASSPDSAPLPWELLWDPRTDVPVAIESAEFVRGYSTPVRSPRLPDTDDEPVRILLVICRPGGADDVPFRSVAARLLKGLQDREGGGFDLEVLRPPTFSQLASELRRAKESNPYHVVHFDGHGTFVPRTDGEPGRGFLVFEGTDGEPEDLIDGAALGSLLVETGVSILLMNACRSATADPPPAPTAEAGAVHERIRAFGSLAVQVMDAGVAGVVAMQYNVYVPTAAQFIGEVYGSLVRGQTLGRAVSAGRKHLHAEPKRDLIGSFMTLQDWAVPVVYEAAPMRVSRRHAADIYDAVQAASIATPSSAQVDPGLPAAPDVGFLGRDEALLALDRAFDRHSVVLLHAYAGSGKTATAAEFARWYSLTGGVDGPVLFTSFERYAPLPIVLEDVQHGFAEALSALARPWLTLSEAERRQLSLRLLSSVESLWVWDNVEAIAGFPAGTQSSWTADEQREIRDFLVALAATRCKVLMTSRRDEQTWLGELPARVSLPPMPKQESLQLARAVVMRRGGRFPPLDAIEPILAFAGGNPLAITVATSEALRAGVTTRPEAEAFIGQLRNDPILEERDGEERSRSLSASLSYGFRAAFSDDDRSRLALLHLFRRVVFAPALRAMGTIDSDSVPQLVGLNEADITLLLERAAEIGHLTAVVPGVYAIHPAIPSFFKSLFEAHYPGSGAANAKRAFCIVMGQFGNAISTSYDDGDTSAVGILAALEDDLVQAFRIALENGWTDLAVRTTLPLRSLYEHQARWVELERLIAQVMHDVVDDETDRALPGRGDEWYVLTQSRVRLAFERRDAGEARRLQELIIEYLTSAGSGDQRATASTNVDSDSQEQLAVALQEHGYAQMEAGDLSAVTTLERSLAAAQTSGSSQRIATSSYALAVALLKLEGARDIERAEQLLTEALGRLGTRDRLTASRIHGELGFIHFTRARGAATSDVQHAELLEAVKSYETALELTPEDAHQSLAAKHMNLATMYTQLGAVAHATPHLQSAIRYAERAGDLWTAGLSRAKYAELAAWADRSDMAIPYYERALDDLRGLPDAASTIADIEAALARLTKPTN